MVEILKQNFDWNYPSDFILNPVNCKGISGKGFALEVKNRFPENEKEYQKICSLNKLYLGSFFISGKIAFIPTKNHWKDRFKSTKYTYLDILNQVPGTIMTNTEQYLFYMIFCSLKSFQKNILDNWPDKNHYIITTPLLGCGLSGGDPKKFINMMKNEFDVDEKFKYIIFDNSELNESI